MADIVDDILILSGLLMKRHAVDCQRLEYVSDVDLGSARDTKMYLWKLQVDNLLHDIEDLLSLRRVPGGIWTFIKGVYDEIEWALSWQFEHALQAFHEHILAGLAQATTVVRKEGRENTKVLVRLVAELDENGRKQVADILLSTIPEVEIKYGDGGQSHSTRVVNFFDDR